jgi:hypothetical protein
MFTVIDKIFSDVCLDERVSGGIFKMEEETHMDALRARLIQRGLTNEESVQITNRMLEGRFPERQAYNKDGVLVTFPTPQHKQRAIQRGTHMEKSPYPQEKPPTPEPQEKSPVKPLEIPPTPPTEKTDNDDDDGDLSKTIPNTDTANVNGDIPKELEVEPPRGDEKPESVPTPPPQPEIPRTPQRVAAEKEIIKQIMATDDSNLSNIQPKLNEAGKYQLNELYKKASEWGFHEAMEILKGYIK